MNTTNPVSIGERAGTLDQKYPLDQLAEHRIGSRVDSRQVYLENKLRDDQPVVIIIAGQSSAGKTVILSNAEKLGAVCGERYMPRHRRVGDTDGDRVWKLATKDYSAEARNHNPYILEPIDLTGPNRFFFAENKYQGYYGFPSKSLVRALKHGDSIGYIVGRCEEIPAMIEGIRNIAPLAAVCVIRADVPLAVLSQRLGTRPEAFPGELEERLGKLSSMADADRPQIAGLTQVYGMRSILNLSESEIAGLGLSTVQVKPATDVQIQQILSDEMGRARERSKTLAADILAVRKLDYGHKFIPDALIDVLDNNLAAACERRGFIPCIKGGLAIGLYLEDSRPVSLDIDFTGCDGPNLEQRMGELLGECSHIPAPIKDCWDKKIYHVRGFPGLARSERFNKNVELDALVITRIQPRNQGFCYVFPFDSYDQFHRRTVTLPSGREVYLCAPEGVIIEKLAAGRSYDVGKFDLFDSAGMLAKFALDPAAIRRLLECHYFDPKLDSDAVELLKLAHFTGVDGYAAQLGITDSKVILILKDLSQLSDTDLSAGPRNVRALTLTSLKRLALIDQLRASINKIHASLHDPVVIADESTSIAKKFGAEKVLAGLSKLEVQLEAYATHELGRLDIYTKRTGTPDSEISRFFARLDQQRQTFSDSLM